jgi:hypothetical protein
MQLWAWQQAASDRQAGSDACAAQLSGQGASVDSQ